MGPRSSPHLPPTDKPLEPTAHAFVNVLTRGDLSSIRWVCSPLRHAQPASPGMQLCTVYYASLNFRDIMLATGKLSADAIPGVPGFWALGGPGEEALPAHCPLALPQASGAPGIACWAWSSLAGTPVAAA